MSERELITWQEPEPERVATTQQAQALVDAIDLLLQAVPQLPVVKVPGNAVLSKSYDDNQKWFMRYADNVGQALVACFGYDTPDGLSVSYVISRDNESTMSVHRHIHATEPVYSSDFMTSRDDPRYREELAQDVQNEERMRSASQEEASLGFDVVSGSHADQLIEQMRAMSPLAAT